MTEENDTFPEFDPPLPKASDPAPLRQYSGEDSANFHRIISDATGTPNPTEFKDIKGPPGKNFEDIFPGQKPMSESERNLLEIKDIEREISTKLDTLPMSIAQAMGER